MSDLPAALCLLLARLAMCINKIYPRSHLSPDANSVSVQEAARPMCARCAWMCQKEPENNRRCVFFHELRKIKIFTTTRRASPAFFLFAADSPRSKFKHFHFALCFRIKAASEREKNVVAFSCDMSADDGIDFGSGSSPTAALRRQPANNFCLYFIFITTNDKYFAEWGFSLPLFDFAGDTHIKYRA